MEKDEEKFCLTVKFKNGSKFSYYGKTQLECLEKFKEKFPIVKGFACQEWTEKQE